MVRFTKNKRASKEDIASYEALIKDADKMLKMFNTQEMSLLNLDEYIKKTAEYNQDLKSYNIAMKVLRFKSRPIIVIVYS